VKERVDYMMHWGNYRNNPENGIGGGLGCFNGLKKKRVFVDAIVVRRQPEIGLSDRGA